MRRLLRRLRHNDQQGFTLIEVVASVVILGIIMVPLGTAMVFGFRTVFGISERLASTADIQRISTYFPSDVASVDADGVNTLRVKDEGICAGSPTEEALITFRWDADLGDGGQTVVRYFARHQGDQSELVRRVCRGSDAPVEIVLASHFGTPGDTEARNYLIPDGATEPTPTCGTRVCELDIHGAYTFHLDAQRRVEGDGGSHPAPGAPTNVHALGGNNRARLFWADPAETGGVPIEGYYVESNGAIVGGDATPTFYTPGSGTTGALIPGLANDQSYRFRVRAHTIVGNGPWSDYSNVVTPGPTTPEPPSLDTAAGDPATDGRVTATWSLPPDYSDGGAAVTGFNLTALNPDAAPTPVTYADPSARSGAVTGLANNTRYQVQVTGLNSHGEGSPSPVPISALTRPGASAAPTAVSNGSAGGAVLSFTLPSGGVATDLTNVRADVGGTFTSAVDVPTACPDQQNCTLVVSGINVSSSTNVTVQVQNATGWGAESAPLVIGADTTPPTVGLTFPANPQYGTAGWNAGCDNGGGAICGTASDGLPGAVASVSVTVRRSKDNRYWNGSAGTGNSQWATSVQNLTAAGTTAWSEPLTTASLENGVTYTITAVAKDTVNRSSTAATRTFSYITGAPTATLSTPPAGGNVGGATVNVSGTATATSPATIASAEFQYSPHSANAWTSIAIDTATPYAAPWDTTAIADGSYDLRMIATDSASNVTTSATRTVTVDNNPPTGSITAPANGAYVRGSAASVAANSADSGSGVANATFQYKPTAGSTWTQIGGVDSTSPYGVSWNTTTLADGSYDLRVITTDNVGLTFTSPAVSVLLDNTGPTIGAPTVAGTLSANGWYTSNVSVTWPAPTDPAGIASTTGCGTTNLTTDTSGQVVTCSATDNAGNTSSNSVTIKRDASAPSGSLTAPDDGDSVTGTVTVSSNSADTTSGVANATFQYSPAGAGTWTTIGAADITSPYSVNWNTAGVADGNYDLRVLTTNNAGTTFTSATHIVYVDRTAPTVAITFPANPQYGTGSYNAGCSNANGAVCGTASDGLGQVAGVTFSVRRSSDNRYWNGSVGTGTGQWSSTATNITTTGTTSWTKAFTTGNLQTGVTYTIVATATDGVGLTGTDTAVFTYLTTAPTAALTAPAANTNQQGTITVSGNATATNPATVSSAEFQYKPTGGSTWTSIAIDTATPYSTPWVTSSVADGSYDLRMITTDSAANPATSATRTITVDNNAPTGSITAPANGSYVHGSTVAVTSNSADAGSGVANATFQYKPTAGSSWTQIGAVDTASPYSVSWNTTTLTDGLYDLRVITTDNVGLTFTSPAVSVLVDNTGPTIGAPTVTGILGANGWYTSNVTVTWPAPTDPAGIASSTGCGTTTITTNTAGQVVTCSATDNAGNTASNSVTIKRDATAPTGGLTAPANGASVTGAVTVSSDSADSTPGSGVANATFQYSPAGAGTWTMIGAADTASPYNVSWNTASLGDGNYDLRVVTTDNAGSPFTSATRTVFVDTTAPTVAITFPTDGATYNAAGYGAGCVTNDVCGTASDAGAVASVTMTIRRSSDSRYWNGNTGTTTTQWSTTPTNLSANGTTAWNRVLTTGSIQTGVTYTIVATATDGVGLTGTDTSVFGYNVTPPIGSITAPNAAANVSDTVTVTSNSAATSPATVAFATFQYKPTAGSTWTTIGAPDTSSPYSAAWDTTLLTDGSYDLRVTTADSAGNTVTSATVTVKVDNTLPTGTLTVPADGAFVRGTAVTVSSNSADTGSGVANAAFQRSPAGTNTWTTIGTDAATPYSTSWNTTSGSPDGDYDLRVITTDNAGNIFTSATRTVTVDNTGPTITPTVTGTLGANGWYTGNVSVNWAVSDSSGIASSTGCATTSITTNTAGQVVTCSATDNAGNSSSQSVTIKRDATAPTGSLTAPNNGTSVTGSVTVSSDSADSTPGSGVANATFQYSLAGAGSWTTIGSPDTTSPYSVSWATGTLADGNYDLRVVTTDNAGSPFTSATRTVFVDTTAPTVAITFPTDGATYNAAGYGAGCVTNDVCGTASDAGAVASVTMTIRRSSDSRYWNGNTGTTTTQWSTTPTNLSANGTTAWNRVFTTGSIQTGVTYTIVAAATDGVGHTGTDTSVFGYNVTPPTGSITAPNAAANVSDTVTVTSNSAATSPATVAFATFQYKPTAGSTWTTIGAPDTSSPYSVAWNTTLLTDGSYDLRVTTADSAGNTVTSATVTVRVDNTNPTGSITAPTNGVFVKGSSVAVSSNSADATAGIQNTTFQRSPAGANTWTTIGTDTTSPYSTTWNTTSLSDGSYDLQVITVDNAGNSFTSPAVTVKVDNNAPTIVGTATGTVGNNGWYTTNVGLTWSVTDVFGVASSTGCAASNVTTDTISTGTTFTCSATDNAGNASSGSVTIKRDATAPTTALTAPGDGAYVKGTSVAMTGTATDATSLVLNVQFQRSPAGANTWTTISTDTSSPYTATWSTTALSDGDYDLRTLATDNAGLQTASAINTVTVDNTKPIPSSVVLANGGSSTVGTVGVGDKITITYSEPIAVNTLCTSWSNNANNQTISNITATMDNNSSDDAISLGGVCAPIGSVNTNASYLSGTSDRTWNNTTVSWSAATKTLVITLGGTQQGGTSSTVSANTTPAYTPTTTISDFAGNTMNATAFNGTPSRF